MSRLTHLRLQWPELVAALLAFVLVILTGLDPTGTYAWLPDGPGLTVDESFNVEQGVRLEIGLRYMLLGAVSLKEVFGTPTELGADAPLGYHLADHPPLGRWLLGVAHDLVTAVAPPTDWPTPFVTAAARFGSAIAFAVTVLLVALFTTRRWGRPAGLTAAAALVLMPRVFGHAHLASLETMIGLFWTATVLYSTTALATPLAASRPVKNESLWKPTLFCGVLLGLALLTKVQAVLLPIPIAAWALWHGRQRAIVPLLLFGATGAIVFFLGWPWLWFDPIDHIAQYLGRTTNRASLPVWYLGRVFADHAVPWHYPFVLFAVTVPVGLHLLGIVGTIAGRRDPGLHLILLCGLFPLVVFAVPGVAVYDGARLFLVCFPLWAVVIGRGGAVAWTWLRTRLATKPAAVVLCLFLALQSYGLFASGPVWLSYYNLAVGGLDGAERLGFEVNYWGDAQTPALLHAAAAAVPPGGTLAVAPVLHQFQLEDLRRQTPVLRQRDIQLVEYGTADADVLLIFYRYASLTEPLRQRTATQPPLAAVTRQGVILAAVYSLRKTGVDARP